MVAVSTSAARPRNREPSHADLEKLKEALEGLLCTPRGRSVLKGMPARRKGKKRQGEDNCPHQRNYLETLLDGSLCHRYASEEDKEVVRDLTGLILYHYHWVTTGSTSTRSWCVWQMYMMEHCQ